MGEKSKIQWTDATWNIAVGCEKVSAGCKFCYMMRDLEGRFGRTDVNGIVTRTKPGTFQAPLKWQKQGRKSEDGNRLKVFTSSLTDMFHESIDSYRDEVWSIIRECPDLIFQILTKRPERISDHLPEDWGEGYENVWLGVSVENQKMAEKRIPELLSIKCQTRFLSVEPLIGPVDLSCVYMRGDDNEVLAVINVYDGGAYGNGEDFTAEWFDHDPEPIDLIIIGGESGNETGKYGYRPSNLDWYTNIIKEAKNWSYPGAIFIKQLGTFLSKDLKITRHGGIMEEWPEELRIREMPKKYYGEE